MPWPLEREGARHFAEGLEEVLVVEEKRAIIENQFKEQLYNWRADVRPRVVGKFDEKGQWVLPSAGELTPAQIAKVIAKRLEPFYTSDAIKARLALLEQKERSASRKSPDPAHAVFLLRLPAQHLDQGSPRAAARSPASAATSWRCGWTAATETFTQMGGEGVRGSARRRSPRRGTSTPISATAPYFHSGLLAIRAAVAAKVNITYKILYNDAVAMTGGQPLDGQLTVPQIAAQVLAEGVGKVVVTSDEPDKYAANSGLPAGVEVFDRAEFDRVQRDLRDTPGVTVLIHDQTCAAEKRRRRKRGTFPDPDRRISSTRGCARAAAIAASRPTASRWCRSTPSTAASAHRPVVLQQGLFVRRGLLPLLRLGARREAEQAARGRDGVGPVRRPARARLPPLARTGRGTSSSPGVGGTGVVTIGALIGMAAHLEGRGVTVLDQTGLAQKGGAVTSHLRIAADADAIHAVRIASGECDALIGCDLVVSAAAETVDRVRAGRTRAVVNAHESPTGEFTRNPDLEFPTDLLTRLVRHAVGDDAIEFLDAQRLATALLGDSIATNPFMLGYAWQRGMVPLSARGARARDRLNAVAVAQNKRAFSFGRLAAHEPKRGRASRLPDAAWPGAPRDAGRAGRASRRRPRRLPERRRRRALPRARGARRRRRGAARAGQVRLRRCGGALRAQADGRSRTSGRSVDSTSIPASAARSRRSSRAWDKARVPPRPAARRRRATPRRDG
jgi:indolepyruvate ferredoxin oxidoreductase